MEKETKFSYQQPGFKVLEIKARRMLCSSGDQNGINKMGVEDVEEI